MAAKSLKDVRKRLRPIKRLFNQIKTRLIELPHKYKSAPIGSSDWLIKAEVMRGGLVTDVARNKVSPLDARTPQELAFGGMTGGDRMLHHGYAPVYARFLRPFLGKKGLRVAEFGVLKGTGLAIWCDLFPDARVLGLDIDPAHFEANRMDLLRRGAFQKNSPEVFSYDQLIDGTGRLTEILRGETLDIVIDDGLHSVNSIVTTWRSVRPHLSSSFVYFIEDYPGLLERCGAEFSGFESASFGMMTVISAGIRVFGGLSATSADPAEESPAGASSSSDYALGRKAVEAKDWANAIQLLTRAEVQDDRNPDLENFLGYAYRNIGRFDEALRHYKAALRMNPRHRGAHEYIGEAYLVLNDLPKAEEHLAALKQICLVACEEYEDLEKAIAVYRARRGR
jgi:hypothetical protein